MPICVLKRGDLFDRMSSRENEARFLHQNEVNLRDRETKWPPTLISDHLNFIKEIAKQQHQRFNHTTTNSLVVSLK